MLCYSEMHGRLDSVQYDLQHPEVAQMEVPHQDWEDYGKYYRCINQLMSWDYA